MPDYAAGRNVRDPLGRKRLYTARPPGIASPAVGEFQAKSRPEGLGR